MKRFTMIVVLVLIVAMPMMAERVTPETARKVASTFLKNNGAKANQLTDLSKAAGFPNLYIFTADEGFVVMSADDCVKPILGYSLTNKFVVEGMPENISSWLQGYSDEIQYAIENQEKASSEVAKQWKALADGKSNVAKTTTIVNALVETRWDQTEPYNDSCPSGCVTGCVATAMAQVMKYWNYPATGIGSHFYTWNNQTLSANFGATPYDWANMTCAYNSQSSETEKAAVATLMHHCGISVNMDYGGGVSSAYTSDVIDALQLYFNYAPTMHYEKKANFTNEEWITMVKNELDAQRPLQYRGKDNSNGAGHSFICDGYDDNNKFHFNWGWSGWCDGFYPLNNLTTNDPGTGGGNGVFTDNQAAIFGIQPVQCSASSPSNLTYTINNLRNVTLSWTEGEGSSSYNIYRNNYYIGNSTETTFAETAPFGTNTYYIRSVDANNQLSLASNQITITIQFQQPTVNDLIVENSNDNASLSWTAPNWCYPETPTRTVSYGDGDLTYFWPISYYAHRYLAEELEQYTDKAVYKVSTYIYYPGTYSAFVYTNTTGENQPDANSCAMSKEGVILSFSGWYDFIFEDPILLTGQNDLWIVIKQENTGQANPVPSFNLSTYNENACYFSNTSPTSLTKPAVEFKVSWFIKAYLTDGIYTYNLYDGTNLVVSNISSTSYTINNIDNNTAHQFMVKTNYYAGESSSSNMAGLTVGTATINGDLTLASNDKMTVTENSTLTVNGTLTNTNANNLIIEDGGQLFTINDTVAATVKKTITGHEPTDLSGWRFIASPVSTVINPIDAGLITDNFGNNIPEGESASYDLYYFDESEELPWKNYRKNSFNLENGKGYLYANNETIDLAFAGILYNGDGGVPMACHDGYLYKGWNLVGNPFTCDASIDRPFFIINGRNLKASTGTIPPCTGVMVQAANVDITNNTIDYTQIAENVTFAKVNPSSTTSLPNQLQITVAQQVVNRDGISTLRQAQGSETIDNAIVSFNKGNLLEKFVFNADLAKLYIPQNGKDFAIVTSEGIGEMPLNFSAAEDGTYTLTVNPEGVEMNYLHLIDNLTGNDVDLLASPDYTFEAKTTDYASRFRLVFASVCEDADSDNENFAFINDGNIIVYKEGTLQNIDITGRIVLSGDTINRVSTSRMTPGVYVLRLITANGVKTQKIIID